MEYSTVINAIERPDYKEHKVAEYQTTKDIIADLIYCFKLYNKQAKPIAPGFYTGNIKTDGRKIYDFIKNNIRYNAEPFKNQTTRSFSRIIHDKWGDCKHSALIVSSLGWQMGYNVIFRFVGYDKGRSYGHVYTLLENPKTGERVIVDPLQDYDFEKSYFKKIDYKAVNKNKSDMTLSRLSGTGTMMPVSGIDPTEIQVIDGIGRREVVMTPNLSDEALGEIEDLQGIGKRTKQERKKVRAEKKVVRKQKQAKRKEVKAEKREKRGGTIFKKVALAPIRGAMSALLLLNFRGFSTRLKKAISINENEVKAVAKKFGYNYNIFRQQIMQGSSKKPLMGIRGVDDINTVEGMGIVISSAAIATAAPAIAAIVAVLKKLGIGEPTDDQTMKEATDNIEKIPTGGGDSGSSNADSYTESSGGGGGAKPSGSGGGAASPGGSGGGGEDQPEPEVPEKKSTRGRGGDDEPSEGLLDKIKKHPVPVLLVSAGIIYVGGKAFKVW